MHKIQAVRTTPPSDMPLSEFVDVYIRVEAPLGPLCRDARGRVWRLVEGGELCCLMVPGAEPVVGEWLDLRPWRG